MFIVVFITASNKKEAQKLSLALVKEKLAACVNILKGIESVFWWEGKVDKAREFLLIVKTKRSLLPKLVKKVKALHSYSVPEIIGLPIIGANKQYLEWLNESTS